MVVVAPAPAVAAVGGRLQQVGVLHGVEAQVLGHHRQRGAGIATQHLAVRGVQEAVVVAGGQAAQLETLLAGVARIRRHRAAGTCDGYCLLALEAGCALVHDQRLTNVLISS